MYIYIYIYINAMRLKITQHGVSCNECNHQGFKPDDCTLCMKRRVG